MCITGATNPSPTTGFHVQFSRDINGKHTEFVFHRFANKWFLMITQFGKMTSIYSVQFDVKRDDAVLAALHAPVEDPERHVSVPIAIKNNFGVDTDEMRSGIQFLVNKSHLNRCPTEIVISLGLKEINGANLREVAKVLDEIIT